MSWLSAFVDSLLPPNIGVESLQTGVDLRATIDKHATTGPISIPHPTPSPTAIDCPPTFDKDGSDRLEGPPDFIAKPKLPPLRDLRPGISPMTLVEAYFSEYHRTFPIMNKTTVINEAQPMLRVVEHESLDISFDSVRLYLIMAIGFTMLSQSNQVSGQASAKFPMLYHEIIQLCLGDPSLHAIQVLLLLAIYSLHDPVGWCPWTLTGILVRQAISLGLDRDVESESQVSRFEVEARRRLFWSVFSIDRAISVAFGLPFALGDGFQVPLPRITTDEFTSHWEDSFLTLQTTRHSIALRELDGHLFSRIHLDSRADVMEEKQHQRITEELSVQAENWYTQGCLYSRMDVHDGPTHKTISWLTANYQRLLALLHCPSQASPHLTAPKLIRLQKLVQNYAQCLYVQFQDGHVPMNRITEARLLVICRLLLYCYSEVRSTDAGELEAVSFKCKSILSGFGPSWSIARRSCDVFHQFIDIIKRFNSNTEGETSNLRDDLMEPIVCESELLIRQALGSSSLYNYLANERKSEKLW